MPTQNIYKEKQKTFYQIIFFGLFGFSLFVFLIINSLAYLSPKVAELGSMCGCTMIINSAQNNQPDKYLAISIITIISCFILFTLYKIVKILFNTLKFTRSFLKHQIKNKSEKLSNIVSELKMENNITQINHNESIVFCHNFIKPKICVSKTIVDKLTTDELKAVLLHEKSHLQSHEPIKILFIKSILSFLFFIPIIKILADKYFTLSEISADEYVVKNFHKTYLASALYKLIDLNKNSLMQKNIALSFFSVIGSRIEYLSANNNFKNYNLFTTKKILSSLTIFIFILSFSWFTYSNKPVDEVANSQNCTLLKQEQKCPSERQQKYAPDYILNNE